MKRITCEMCGSTDLLKKDGVFECQSCGTKYTVEEAKKMMVEGTVNVEGTVKIDSSNRVSNLLKNSKKLYDDGKYDEAYSNFSEVLNIDSENYIAEAYRGLSSAWKSTFGKPLIIDGSNGVVRSLELASEQLGLTDEYRDFSMELFQEFFTISKLCIDLYLNTYKTHYAEFTSKSEEYQKKVKEENLDYALRSFQNALNGIGPSYSNSEFYLQQWDAEAKSIQETQKTCYKGLKDVFYAIDSVISLFFQDRFLSLYNIEQYQIIKKYMVDCKDAIKGYVSNEINKDYTTLLAACNLCDEEIKKIKDKYWEEHSEEKEELEEKISSTKKKIEELHSDINTNKSKKEELRKEQFDEVKPLIDKINSISEKLNKLNKELKDLGLFKSKEKEMLKKEIEKHKEAIANITNKIFETRENIKEKQEKNLTKIENKIEKDIIEINKLVDELEQTMIKRYEKITENTNKLRYVVNNNDEEVYFCERCGAEFTGFPSECPECGIKFSYEDQFLCPNCGKSFEGKQSSCPHCGIRFT